MSQNNADHNSLVEALQWHLDNGADEMLLDAPVDRTAMPELPTKSMESAVISRPQSAANGALSAPVKGGNIIGLKDSVLQNEVSSEMMGAAQAIVEAQELAAKCKTLEELSAAIKEFEGLSIRKTATNMVFGDGNPKAAVMVIGEAPTAEDDIQGKAFMGQSGALEDKILACIDLDRTAEDPLKSIYLTNILNWRPPGNRTPTQAEMDISLPFIERHIALIQPKALILLGGGVGKALLRRTESISKLRGKTHEYQIPEALRGNVQGEAGIDEAGADNAAIIPTIVTYQPEYLLRTPAQKKAVWADMLMFQEKLEDILT